MCNDTSTMAFRNFKKMVRNINDRRAQKQQARRTNRMAKCSADDDNHSLETTSTTTCTTMDDSIPSICSTLYNDSLSTTTSADVLSTATMSSAAESVVCNSDDNQNNHVIRDGQRQQRRLLRQSFNFYGSNPAKQIYCVMTASVLLNFPALLHGVTMILLKLVFDRIFVWGQHIYDQNNCIMKRRNRCAFKCRIFSLMNLSSGVLDGNPHCWWKACLLFMYAEKAYETVANDFST